MIKTIFTSHKVVLSAEVGRDDTKYREDKWRKILMRMIRSILVLLLVVGITTMPVATAACDPGRPPVTIWKQPWCAFGSSNPDTFTTNSLGAEPDYIWYMGDKITVWLRIKVIANQPLTNIMVFDRLGAEWMIDGIAFEDTGMPDWWNYITEDLDYEFVYKDLGGNVIDTETDPIVYGGTVTADGVAGTVNKEDGLTLGSPSNDFGQFVIRWTGKSCKVHFQWNIDAMGQTGREVKMIFLVISTDRNPAGKQEFTSTGCYELNSGAVVKALNGRLKKVVDETSPIFIHIIDDEG